MDAPLPPRSEKRDHGRPVANGKTKSTVTKWMRGLEKNLRRKVGRLQNGAFYLTIAATHESKTKGVREIRRVAGDPQLIEHHFFAGTEAAPARGELDESAYLTIPGSAEARVTNVRTFLQEAWKIHVKEHAPNFAGKKQMYKLVKEHGAPAFGWWARVVGEGVPFDARAVANATVSYKLYEFLGPRLLEHKHGRVSTLDFPSEAVADVVVEDAAPACDRPTIAAPPRVVEEWPRPAPKEKKKRGRPKKKKTGDDEYVPAGNRCKKVNRWFETEKLPARARDARIKQKERMEMEGYLIS